MARYPKAFETWYTQQVRTRGAEFDTIIIRMRDNREVKTLLEGERRLRKMLYVEWLLDSADRRQAFEDRAAFLDPNPETWYRKAQ